MVLTWTTSLHSPTTDETTCPSPSAATVCGTRQRNNLEGILGAV
jgi:hypothetical protein